MPYLFCLFLLLLTIPASAQLPVYLHYGIEEGLPSNLVYCAEQDKEGYIWFGTDKGLSRFDGERFKNYGVRDGLPDPEVLHLYADRKSRLWIGCFHQKPAYRTGGQFHTASTDTNLQQMSFRYQNYDFYEDSDSTLWITSGNIIGLDSRNLSKKPWGRNVHLGVIWARKMNDTWLGFGGRPIYRLDFQSDTINRTLL